MYVCQRERVHTHAREAVGSGCKEKRRGMESFSKERENEWKKKEKMNERVLYVNEWNSPAT